MVLTGFMGTGKSSVGVRLAARLGAPFVDTDAIIERRTGRTIAALFADGEAHFRAAERQAIAEAVGVPRAVIATGGGAIVDPENLATLRAAAPVVCLTARPDVILRRTSGDAAVRPLLAGGDAEQRIAALLDARATAYARADASVDTSDRPLDAVVDEIETLLRTIPSREVPT